MNFYLQNYLVLVTQSCSTLWDPMDCNLPGSSVPVYIQIPIKVQRVQNFERLFFQRLLSRIYDSILGSLLSATNPHVYFYQEV